MLDVTDWCPDNCSENLCHIVGCVFGLLPTISITLSVWPLKINQNVVSSSVCSRFKIQLWCYVRGSLKNLKLTLVLTKGKFSNDIQIAQLIKSFGRINKPIQSKPIVGHRSKAVHWQSHLKHKLVYKFLLLQALFINHISMKYL